MWTIELTVMTIMVVVNSVFAAFEIALTSIGMGRLDTLARQNRRGAASARRMKQKMEASLAVVQLGITLVGAVAAATGGAGAEESVEPWLVKWGFSGAAAQFLAIGIVVAPLTIVTIIFGELVPKVFALRNSEWVCLRLSPLMEWFALIVWPAVWFFETAVTWIMHLSERRWKSGASDVAADETTIQELTAVAALARTSRLIGHRQESMIVNAARLSSTSLRAIMLPAAHIRMLYLHDSLGDTLVAAHHDMHTRYPVTERRGDPSAIVGYVNYKDIVACLHLMPTRPGLTAIVRSMPNVSPADNVASCLETLIREHCHIAIVRNSATRAVEGMVTLEDILEELVGEIHDEYDRLPAHLSMGPGGCVVGGGVTVDRVERLANVRLAGTDSPSQTVNDWICKRLGRIPAGGDQIVDGRVRVFVRKVRRERVLEAQVSSDGGDAAASSGVSAEDGGP